MENQFCPYINEQAELYAVPFRGNELISAWQGLLMMMMIMTAKTAK